MRREIATSRKGGSSWLVAGRAIDGRGQTKSFHGVLAELGGERRGGVGCKFKSSSYTSFVRGRRKRFCGIATQRRTRYEDRERKEGRAFFPSQKNRKTN